MTNEDEFEQQWKLLKGNLIEISDYQESDSTNKINGGSPQYSSTSDMFHIEFSIMEFRTVLAQEYMFQK